MPMNDAALATSDPEGEYWGWGCTPNQSGDGWGFLMMVINAFGGSYTDETGLVVTFDSPETLAAVEWIAETYSNEMYADMLPPGILSWTDISNNEAYLAGTVGYTHNAFSIYAQAKRDESEYFDDTMLMLAPLGPANLRQDGGSNAWLTIFKGAPNIDLAKQLAVKLIANVTSGRMTPAEALTDAHNIIVDIFEEGGIMQP